MREQLFLDSAHLALLFFSHLSRPINTSLVFSCNISWRTVSIVFGTTTFFGRPNNIKHYDKVVSCQIATSGLSNTEIQYPIYVVCHEVCNTQEETSISVTSLFNLAIAVYLCIRYLVTKFLRYHSEILHKSFSPQEAAHLSDHTSCHNN